MKTKSSASSKPQPQTTGLPKRVLTEREAASYISMSRSFLRQSRLKVPRQNMSPGPTFVKLGRSVRYLIEDLDAWLMKYRENV